MNLSVVIPSFNSLQTLKRTVESILVQIPPDTEIVVIDDCSSDGSINLISDLPIKIIHNSKNLGSAAVRNIGITETKGEWLLFIDSDVVPNDQCIYNMISNIKTANDIFFPRIVYTNSQIMYPVTTSQKSFLMISPIFMIRRASMRRMNCPLFDDNYRIYCEDTDFFLRAFLAGLKCSFVENAEAEHDVRPKPGNREARYYQELKNSIYGAVKFAGILEIRQFDHAFKFINILKLIIAGLFNFNLFDLQARGYRKPRNIWNGFIMLFGKHDRLSDRGTIFLLLLIIKALYWNFTKLNIALAARKSIR